MKNMASSATDKQQQKRKQINQWVSKISNFDARSDENLNYLNSILGPLKSNHELYQRLDNESFEAIKACGDTIESSGQISHQIIFKIDEKVFIESIDIYEKSCDNASLFKIEAKEIKPNKEEMWHILFETDKSIPAQSSAQIFSPKLNQTNFKSDTIRITVSGNIRLIEAVEVKGNKYVIDDENEHFSSTNQPVDQFTDYCLLSKQLHSLLQNHLFADVIFEVEGKQIPAHRNILVSRSEYFRAMLSQNSAFKESKSNTPIYVGEITYEIFIQVLHFLYTGHVDLSKFPYFVAVELMRAADKMNLVELEKVCLFHLSLMINQDNVIKIYKETHDKNPIIQAVVQMCHDEMSAKFAYISRTSDFCSLPQELMIKIIENIVPKLNRITSVQLESELTNISTPSSFEAE
jgi:hypothetical protein